MKYSTGNNIKRNGTLFVKLLDLSNFNITLSNYVIQTGFHGKKCLKNLFVTGI